MSESATSLRPLSGAEEFDRRRRAIGGGATPLGDAMAELARLVGHQDPFGRAEVPAQGFEPGRSADADLAAYAAQMRIDAAEEPGLPDEPAVLRPAAPEAWERAVPRYPSVSIHDHRPIEPSPDVWAQSVPEPVSAEAPALSATRDAEPPAAKADAASPRRTLLVLAAVVVLTGGGLGASFLARPSGTSSMVASASTPTILAATTPNKVQPETATADTPSEPSTLLDKNNNDGTAAAKVVNTVEQPVDLNQAVKPSVDAANAPDAPPSPFPEPRKVKTVLVRPDGSIIADAPAAPAVSGLPATSTQQASLAFDPQTVLPMPSASAPPAEAAAPPASSAPAPVVAMPDAAMPQAPKPAKTTTRATPIRPAASTGAAGSDTAQARTPVSTPKVRPGATAKPKPEQTAAAEPAATDDTPTAATGGGFAVQLGAAPNEAEGNSAAGRLSAKYGLGANKATVRKAEAGGKTVYRIRVGNLGQDEAKALCAKVQAGGGSCFVARN